MDGIRAEFTPPLLPPKRPAPAEIQDSPYTGAADEFRATARLRLQTIEPNAGPALIELTALQLAEQKFLQFGAPAPQLPLSTPLRGMLGTATYLGSMAAAQMGVPPALAPTMIGVLGDLDPFKIFGPPRENGANAWIIAGACVENQIKASQAAGTGATLVGIPVSGILDPAEVGRLRDAFQPLLEQMGPERVKTLVKNLHVQTLLGEMQIPGQTWTMGGLGGSGLIALSRESILNPALLKNNLGHELGHLVDEDLGRKLGLANLSEAPHSPFGKGDSLSDFRSEYARMNAGEDFAETHADLMLHWDTLKKNPQLTMLTRGKYGEKLAFIAREAYGWKIPPADPGLTQMREAVLQGQSPFGFYDDQGQLVAAEQGLNQAVTDLAEDTGPPGQRAGRQWLDNHIHGQTNPPCQAIRVSDLVGDLIQVAQLPADHPDRAHCSDGVLGRLEQGGPYFFASSRKFIQENYPPQQAEPLLESLNRYLAAAVPAWGPVS